MGLYVGRHASWIGDARLTTACLRCSGHAWDAEAAEQHAVGRWPDAAPAVTPAAPRSWLVLRVMSWNLWWRFGPWVERQAAIAAILDAEAPDLVGSAGGLGRGGRRQPGRVLAGPGWASLRRR